MCNFEPNATQIIRNLWLGNGNAALDINFLNKNNIQYIVNITPDIPCVFNHINYLQFGVYDYQLCGRSETINDIDHIVKFMRNGLSQGGLLVHCKHGHHRSASIVLAYLLKYTPLTFNEGCQYIRSKRPCALAKWKHILMYVYRYYLLMKNNGFNKHQLHVV
jgi:dual specificity MAP kinase phosphatase